MNREPKDNKSLIEEKSQERETKTETDAVETNNIAPADRKCVVADTSILLSEEEPNQTNFENPCLSNPKKRKQRPSLRDGSERFKTSKLMETIKAPVHSPPTVDNNAETGASSVQLTATGESYFNNMIMALELEKLDVSTFCAILPHICNDYTPEDDWLDQGEIILLCDDLIEKAKAVLSKKSREVIVRDGEEKTVSKLELIIEELGKHQDFTVM